MARQWNPRWTFEDYIRLLIPSNLYYRRKIAAAAKRAEPELAILRDIVPRDCTAIDVGAHSGIYSYALRQIAGRVEAFEPHPVLAGLIRAKLAPKVRVHEAALSDRVGTATFYIPVSPRGGEWRFGGSLDNVNPGASIAEITVRSARLDDYGFERVGFIKIDCEGAEMKILAGAAGTIKRDRPTLLVELIAPYHATVDEIEQIKSKFRYDAWIVMGTQRIEAVRALHSKQDSIRTCNVLFTPR
jgi:FkbM family methyltransferase